MDNRPKISMFIDADVLKSIDDEADVRKVTRTSLIESVLRDFKSIIKISDKGLLDRIDELASWQKRSRDSFAQIVFAEKFGSKFEHLLPKYESPAEIAERNKDMVR